MFPQSVSGENDSEELFFRPDVPLLMLSAVIISF